MDNEKNEPEPYKDVIHEDKIYESIKLDYGLFKKSFLYITDFK